MSKYTEVKEVLYKNKPISYPRECGGILCDAITDKTLEEVVEALEIADRLEQADVTKCEDAYYNYDDSEYGQGYENGFEHGYNTALADIRGDAE